MGPLRKNLLLTGLPGVGKTTLIRGLARKLEDFNPVGFYTAEIREGGVRKGFELISLNGRKSSGILEGILPSSMKWGRWSAFRLASEGSWSNSSIRRNGSLRRLLSKEAGSLTRSSEDRISDSSKSILGIESLLRQKFSTPSGFLMREEKIDVIAYSGYRGEESPKAFVCRGRPMTTVEILRRWIEEEMGKRKRRRFFEVRGSDDRIHRIVYDEESCEWFYVRND